MKISLGLFLLALSPSLHAGPAGPGGVSGDLKLWLKSENIGKNPAGLGTWDDSSPTPIPVVSPPDGPTAVPTLGLDGRRIESRALNKRDLGTTAPFYTPVLYLKLNDPSGSTTASDSLLSSRFGTITGSPQQQVKFFGSNGTDFDGVDDSILLAGDADLRALRTNFTISVWIKPRNHDGAQRIISAQSGTGGWGFGKFGANFVFTTYGIQDYGFPQTVPLNVWSHLELTVSGPNANATLKVNGGATFGVPANEATVTGSAQANVATGTYHVGDAPGFNQKFSGAIADLVVLKSTNANVPFTQTDQHEIITNGKSLKNNGQNAVNFTGPASYRTGAGWAADVNNEITLFITHRHEANTSVVTGGPSTVLFSRNSHCFVQLPDSNGKIGFHFGSIISNNYETASGVVRADYNNGLSRDDASGFRSFCFFNSGAAGSRILEGGVLLAQGAAGSATGWADGELNVKPAAFGSNVSDRSISEVIMFNRALTFLERTLVTNYVSAKFGQSPPKDDWYAGDESANGDFDSEVIGIATENGLSQQTTATGGGLVLTNGTFLNAPVASLRRYLVAGNKVGGLDANRIPAAVAMSSDKWWFFDVSATAAGVADPSATGTVNVSVDYSADSTGRVLPPAAQHFLLYSATQNGSFSIVASAMSTPTTVDFGALAVGSALKKGYYAIGYNRPIAAATPPPAKTYTFAFNAAADPAIRNANSWQVNAASADAALATALTEINARPNDGSTYLLDLKALLKTGSGPTSNSNELIIPRFAAWPAINRNLIIAGPVGFGFPGRLVIGSMFNGNGSILAINDGAVTIKNLTLNNGSSGLGGAILAMRADLLLDTCIIKNCRAVGINGDSLPLSPGSPHHGGFYVAGQNGSAVPSLTPPSLGGSGGFGAGGGAQGNSPFASWPGPGGWGACDGFSSIRGGSAGLGGGIFQYRGKLRIFKSALTGNSAVGGSGGRIYDSAGNFTTIAAGLGGAVFTWSEAKLESMDLSHVSGNTAQVGSGFTVVPNGFGVRTNDFYGYGYPDSAVVNIANNILDTNYINQVTGALNPTSPTAYEYLLYKLQAGNVVPDYATFDTTFGSAASLATFDTQITQLKTLVAQYPDVDYLRRLLLDYTFHRAVIYGIKGDSGFQACLDGPLSATYRPIATAFSVHLNADVICLTAALSNYTTALTGYFSALQDPTIYEAFKRLVPDIQYHTFFYADGNNGFLPVAGVAGGNLAEWEATRYRDVALLFDQLADFGRTSELLIDTLQRRNAPVNGPTPSDLTTALNTAVKGQRCLQTWGDTLLNIFGTTLVPNDSATPGLARSIGLWRESVSRHTTLVSALKGEKNPLGYDADFLMLLPPSVVAQQNGGNNFQTYDALASIINSQTGFLVQAETKLSTAKTAHAAFVATRATLAAESTALISSYRTRLKSITGKFPEDSGFDTPWQNVSSEIWEQFNKIQTARTEIKRSSGRINTLKREVDIEIDRVEKQKGVNISRDTLTLSYQDKVAKVDEKIAAIQTTQNILGGITDALNPEGFTNAPVALATMVVKLVNVGAQEAGEQGKKAFEAQKGELADKNRKENTDLTNQTLDIDSKALIMTRLLQMDELNLDSLVAAEHLRQELGRYTALLDEQKQLVEKIALAQGAIANRIYADPSQRLEVEQEYQDALFAFRIAQQFLFFTTKALEYKTGKTFSTTSVDGGYTLQRLFSMRSATELRAYFTQLDNFNTTNSPGINPQTDWFSVRVDGLGLKADASDDSKFTANWLTRSIAGENRWTIDFSTVRRVPGGTFLTPTSYLDKIIAIKVLVTYKTAVPSPTTGAKLHYGDTSFFRTPSLANRTSPVLDELRGELNSFTNREWIFDNNADRYVQTSYPGTDFTARQILAGTQLTDEAALPLTNSFEAFKERSVAATNWQLSLPTSLSFTIVGDIKDVKLFITHTSSTRQN